MQSDAIREMPAPTKRQLTDTVGDGCGLELVASKIARRHGSKNLFPERGRRTEFLPLLWELWLCLRHGSNGSALLGQRGKVFQEAAAFDEGQAAAEAS